MREETSGEKLWNAITHGVGVVGSVVALIFLIIYAVQEGTVWHIVSFSLYGATLLILYTMSTVYHSVSQSSCKKVFKKLDHVSIYLLIAGTYIPFCLTVLRGTWGWPIFWCIMGLAIIGILYEVFGGRKKFPKVSLALYLLMGWLLVVGAKPLMTYLSPQGLWLIALGGVCYTVGTIFYSLKKVPYMHVIWHVFVLGGSVCHFFAVLQCLNA